MQVVSLWWIEQGGAAWHYCVCRLVEKERWVALVIAKFFGMFTIVAANAKYTSHWTPHRAARNLKAWRENLKSKFYQAALVPHLGLWDK
tara:strand:+ start:4769 stop:5035 length:267 start_codon:yes stop_codon:yes gene_type:complete